MTPPGLLLAALALLSAGAGPDAPAPGFLKDVAPILVQNCIGCHNAKKAEGKYVMTTFAQLAAGGAQGKGMTLVPGEPDDSYLVELIRHDGEPRMPYKLDPLPAEKVAVIESWVKAGAPYDGSSPTEDWTAVLRKNAPVTIPDSYPVAVPITALAFSPDGAHIATSGYHELNLWSTADGTPSRRLRPWASASTTSPTAPTASGSPPPAATPASPAPRDSGLPSPTAAASRPATWSRPPTASSPSPSAPIPGTSPSPASTAPSASSPSRPAVSSP